MAEQYLIRKTRGNLFLTRALESRTNDCIEWPFYRNQKGYGLIKRAGKKYTASRLLLVISSGVEHSHLQCMHSCHNPSCVNPRHLSWGTQEENNLARSETGRIRKGVNSPVAVLTEKQVVAMFLAAGTHRTIAAEFFTDHRTVGRIKRREIWKSVTDHL